MNFGTHAESDYCPLQLICQKYRSTGFFLFRVSRLCPNCDLCIMTEECCVVCKNPPSKPLCETRESEAEREGGRRTAGNGTHTSVLENSELSSESFLNSVKISDD